VSRKEKGNTLKINGKEVSFKNSDAKLFRNLRNAANNLGRALQKSGKITGEEVIDNMIESCLSIMLILHDVLASSLDVKNHSVRRLVSASYSAEKSLLAVFNTARSTGRTQTWERWEIMSAYGRLSLCHIKVMRRLNGAIISALRKTVHTLEERRREVENLGDYLVEIAIFSLQIEENIETLLDNSDLLRLEEHQVSQLHKLLGRVKTLLEWKRPQD
jgi:hypothetical protein